MSDTPENKFLHPEVLAKLGNLQIKAQQVVEGIIAGLHRSPFQGGSIEFAEYVEYTPGMEIKHIDWRVFGRSDKFYVKQFEDETNLRSYLVLDSSGSMAFKGEDAPITKLEYMSYLAASLAYLFLRQGDAVGALSFDSQAHSFLPASAKSSHLEDLFYLLEHLPGTGTTQLKEALNTIAERAKSRSFILLFSDMLGADEEVMNLLRVLRQRRYQIVVFHLLDPAELDLPYEGLTFFEGMEGEDALLADPDDLRQRYIARMKEHLTFVETQCQEGDIHYIRGLTTEALDEVCLRFLRGRV